MEVGKNFMEYKFLWNCEKLSKYDTNKYVTIVKNTVYRCFRDKTTSMSEKVKH